MITSALGQTDGLPCSSIKASLSKEIPVEIVERQRRLDRVQLVDRQLPGDHHRDLRQFDRQTDSCPARKNCSAVTKPNIP